MTLFLLPGSVDIDYVDVEAGNGEKICEYGDLEGESERAEAHKRPETELQQRSRVTCTVTWP